jgi:hypothetical protein
MDQQTERDAPQGRPVETRFDYASPDVLMRDMGGANGEDARALATGYMMAIHDADADCLSASTLLGYLRCQGGSAKELTGLGYVMAVRDSMQSMAPAGQFPFATADRSRMRGDARIVKDWLERHPLGFLQPAIAAVHLALADVIPAAVRRPRLFPVLLAGLSWARKQSILTKGLATVAVAIAVLFALHREPPEGHGWQDLAVGRSAENITTLLLEQRRYEKDSIINVADPAESQAYARKWEDARVALLGNLDALASLDLDDEDRQSIGQIRGDLQLYDQGYVHLLTQMRSGQIHTPQDANRLLDSYKSAAHRAEANGVRIAARALGRLHAQ